MLEKALVMATIVRHWSKVRGQQENGNDGPLSRIYSMQLTFIFKVKNMSMVASNL